MLQPIEPCPHTSSSARRQDAMHSHATGEILRRPAHGIWSKGSIFCGPRLHAGCASSSHCAPTHPAWQTHRPKIGSHTPRAPHERASQAEASIDAIKRIATCPPEKYRRNCVGQRQSIRYHMMTSIYLYLTRRTHPAHRHETHDTDRHCPHAHRARTTFIPPRAADTSCDQPEIPHPACRCAAAHHLSC